MPIFGHMTATLSIIESSMRIEEDFFSVAITIPLEAFGDIRVMEGYDKMSCTLDAEACGTACYRCEGMLDLN
jgi:hypothetical protein